MSGIFYRFVLVFSIRVLLLKGKEDQKETDGVRELNRSVEAGKKLLRR